MSGIDRAPRIDRSIDDCQEDGSTQDVIDRTRGWISDIFYISRNRGLNFLWSANNGGDNDNENDNFQSPALVRKRFSHGKSVALISLPLEWRREKRFSFSFQYSSPVSSSFNEKPNQLNQSSEEDYEEEEEEKKRWREEKEREIEIKEEEKEWILLFEWRRKKRFPFSPRRLRRRRRRRRRKDGEKRKRVKGRGKGMKDSSSRVKEKKYSSPMYHMYLSNVPLQCEEDYEE